MEKENEKTIEPEKILAEQMALLSEESKKEGISIDEKISLANAIAGIYALFAQF